MEHDSFDSPELFYGRSLLPYIPPSDVATIVKFSEAALSRVAPQQRQSLLAELEALLEAMAPQLGWERRVITGGTVLWSPLNGGPVPLRTDVDLVADPELYRIKQSAGLAKRVDRNLDRAVIKLIAIVVLRDWERGDRFSVSKVRDYFDAWCIRLILEDERTHDKRRTGGRHRSRELQSRQERAAARIQRLADRYEKAKVPVSEWVKKIDETLDRGSDAPYPKHRTIRRALQKAGRLE